VARVAQVMFVTIGLAYLLLMLLMYTTDLGGPILGTISGILYVVVMFGLPLMAAFTVVWLVVEFVRRFRRCRATRLA
jgi:hypothetical protein